MLIDDLHGVVAEDPSAFADVKFLITGMMIRH
jgi:hypothetical protein